MNYLLNWVREASQTCYAFTIYDQIVHQSRKRSFMYFLILSSLTIGLIYPSYINRQLRLIEPLFEFLEDSFPTLDFENYTLTTRFESPLSLKTPLFHIWIDPDKTSPEPLFDDVLLSVNKTGIEVKTRHTSNSLTHNVMPYDGYYLKRFLMTFADIENGTGTLTRSFFSGLKHELSANKISNFAIFTFMFLFISLGVQLILAFLGKFYARWINAPLNWKNLINLGYYSLTPVFLFVTAAFYFGYTLTNLFPVALGAYFLFFSNSIRRFATPPPVKEEEPFQFF